MQELNSHKGWQKRQIRRAIVGYLDHMHKAQIERERLRDEENQS
jgi:hypothetical protein